jgi:hypothetical protein
MRPTITLSIKVINNEKWADLTVHGESHLICGEKWEQRSDMSFAGQHRVRLFRFKKNVHWKIPDGTDLDISGRSASQSA